VSKGGVSKRNRGKDALKTFGRDEEKREAEPGKETRRERTINDYSENEDRKERKMRDLGERGDSKGHTIVVARESNS